MVKGFVDFFADVSIVTLQNQREFFCFVELYSETALTFCAVNKRFLMQFCK